MKLSIRAFTESDYDAISEIETATWIDDAQNTPADIRRRDEILKTDSSINFARFVGTANKKVVGFIDSAQVIGMYHPQKFRFNLSVHPEFQRHGFGKQLFNHMMQHLEQYKPVSVLAETQENKPQSLKFLEVRGFVEVMHVWESRLQVSNFDFAPYVGLEAQLQCEGIELHSIASLELDSQMPNKFFDVFRETRLDIPRSEPTSDINFEQFLNWTFRHPHFVVAANFVAVRDDVYLGMTALHRTSGEDWTIGLTGVRRTFRGRKIALALKVKALEYAVQHKIPQIITWNASNNTAILELNTQLGFVRQPAFVTFKKTFREENKSKL
jgi:ribosomal protein S18 acetylase RimI-like enzyme